MARIEHCWAFPAQSLTQLTLAPGNIHIWAVELEQPEEQLQQLLALLSPDERSRAARFRFARDRNHFIIARGVLRKMLSHYVGQSADELQFTYGPYGKPTLMQSNNPNPEANVQFNLSHAADLALYAFTFTSELGIDVEALRPLEDIATIAKHFFATQEQSALAALPPADQVLGFCSCWTRKEAYLKVLGSGLVRPLDQFAVTLAPDEPRLIQVEGDTEEAKNWRLYSFTPAVGYVGALAIPHANWALICHRWPLI